MINVNGGGVCVCGGGPPLKIITAGSPIVISLI